MFKLQAENTQRLRGPGPDRNRRLKRSGAATVEMAFVAPAVFLLIFGSIEFSRMMMIRQALTNAAREGCRSACLVTSQDDENSDQVVRDTLRGVIANHDDPEVLRVTIDPPFSVAPVSGTRITTVVEIDCADISWLPPFFFSGARIRGSSSMNRE